MTIRYIVLSVASVALVGCHWVPSSYTVPPVEDQLPDVHYHKAEKPDLEKSKLFGIPKLHPGWLTGFYPMSPPPEWKPSWPDCWRGVTWHLRNPNYNCYSYVIGVADRDCYRTGPNPSSRWKADGRGGLKFNMVHCPPWMHLPHVSLRIKPIEAYIGWNQRGEFGLALWRYKAKDHHAHNGHDDRLF